MKYAESLKTRCKDLEYTRASDDYIDLRKDLDMGIDESLEQIKGRWEPLTDADWAEIHAFECGELSIEALKCLYYRIPINKSFEPHLCPNCGSQRFALHERHRKDCRFEANPDPQKFLTDSRFVILYKGKNVVHERALFCDECFRIVDEGASVSEHKVILKNEPVEQEY